MTGRDHGRSVHLYTFCKLYGSFALQFYSVTNITTGSNTDKKSNRVRVTTSFTQNSATQQHLQHNTSVYRKFLVPLGRATEGGEVMPDQWYLWLSLVHPSHRSLPRSFTILGRE